MTRTIGKIRACCMGVTIFRLNANAAAQTQARIRRGKLAATLVPAAQSTPSPLDRRAALPDSAPPLRALDRSERTLARRDAGLDELVDREAAFLAELEDRQLLVGEVLRTSGDAEVSDGFQGGVQEKVKWGLFRSVKDYIIQNIV